MLKRGDLLHVPANTYFFKVRLEDDCIKGFEKSTSPKACLLISSSHHEYHSVMVNNDVWYVRKKDAFIMCSSERMK